MTTWLRAAGVSDDFQDYYCFLAALGRKTRFVASQLLLLVLRTLPLGDRILAVVDEDHDWYPFFSTDPNAKATKILESFGDRATIEQDFHDVKEVWGAGQQQVRNIWTNLAVYHLNLWMHTLVELWSWNGSHSKLCDRSQSPWDDADRRPSHADRRKALQRQIMQHELSTLAAVWRLPRKILQFVQRPMDQAC